MKIAKSKLQRIIREEISRASVLLLTEAAKTPEELPDGVEIIITGSPDGWDIDMWLRGDVNPDDPSLRFMGPGGQVKIFKPDPAKKTGQFELYGNCADAYSVQWSDAPDGWGPMLYDIAIELTGKNGLMADRADLSNAAYSIWDYYHKNRPDIEKRPLDIPTDIAAKKQLDQRTPNDETDDCASWTIFDMNSGTDSQWVDSPLAYAYRANGTPTIDTLKSLGKIRFVSQMNLQF